MPEFLFTCTYYKYFSIFRYCTSKILDSSSQKYWFLNGCVSNFKSGRSVDMPTRKKPIRALIFNFWLTGKSALYFYFSVKTLLSEVYINEYVIFCRDFKILENFCYFFAYLLYYTRYFAYPSHKVYETRCMS